MNLKRGQLKVAMAIALAMSAEATISCSSCDEMVGISDLDESLKEDGIAICKSCISKEVCARCGQDMPNEVSDWESDYDSRLCGDCMWEEGAGDRAFELAGDR